MATYVNPEQCIYRLCVDPVWDGREFCQAHWPGTDSIFEYVPPRRIAKDRPSRHAWPPPDTNDGEPSPGREWPEGLPRPTSTPEGTPTCPRCGRVPPAILPDGLCRSCTETGKARR